MNIVTGCSLCSYCLCFCIISTLPPSFPPSLFLSLPLSPSLSLSPSLFLPLSFSLPLSLPPSFFLPASFSPLPLSLPFSLSLFQPSNQREIFHYHFKAWPDHGVPQDPGTVLSFLQDINSKQDELISTGYEPGPLIVHCSAGIGRTGTFIVIDILLNVMMQQGGCGLVGVAIEYI